MWGHCFPQIEAIESWRGRRVGCGYREGCRLPTQRTRGSGGASWTLSRVERTLAILKATERSFLHQYADALSSSTQTVFHLTFGARPRLGQLPHAPTLNRPRGYRILCVLVFVKRINTEPGRFGGDVQGILSPKSGPNLAHPPPFSLEVGLLGSSYGAWGAL